MLRLWGKREWGGKESFTETRGRNVLLTRTDRRNLQSLRTRGRAPGLEMFIAGTSVEFSRYTPWSPFQSFLIVDYVHTQPQK